MDSMHMGDDTEPEETVKNLSAYLIVNWKDETIKSRKTEPSQSKLSPYEIAIPASVEVVVPDVEVPELTARIEVPRANVESGLIEDAAREGDPEAWKEVADDLLDRAVNEGRELDSGLVMELVGMTLTESEVHADPEHVRHYVRRQIQERAEA